MLPERPSGPWTDPSSDMTKLLRSQAPVAGARIPVELDQRRRRRPARASVPPRVEDQPHRAILAGRLGARLRPMTMRHNQAHVEEDQASRPDRFRVLSRSPSCCGCRPERSTWPGSTPPAHPGFPGAGRPTRPLLTEALAPELGDLQERLYANGRVAEAGAKRILIVLQGMDTSGKGGVIRHAIGMVDPQGVTIKAFKAPTEEERAHHYLWRIERELPAPGIIGIFDRSQYEDVLIVRVNKLVEESGLEQALRRDQRLRGAPGRPTARC